MTNKTGWGGVRPGAGGPQPGSGPKPIFGERKTLAVQIDPVLFSRLDEHRGFQPRHIIVTAALMRYLANEDRKVQRRAIAAAAEARARRNR